MQKDDALEIWFMRHAESEANVRRIFANEDCYFPLTENGLRQATAIAHWLSTKNVRAVYSSPLERAAQTAAEICRIKRIDMQVAPELREYSVGIYEGTSTLPGSPGAISDSESKKRWFEDNDPEAKSPGGESLNDMKGRFLPFVEKVIQNWKAEIGTILIVTHAGILKAMLPFVFKDLWADLVSARSIGHLDIIKGQIRNGRFVCVEFTGPPVAPGNLGKSQIPGDNPSPGLLTNP